MVTYVSLDKFLCADNIARIGVSGAHGVGKTTLVKKIVKETNLLYIPEFAKYLIETFDFDWKNLSLSDATNFESAIYHCYVFALSLIDKQHKSYISDRTLIDVASYCLWHISRGENSEYMVRLYNKIISYIIYNDFWDVIIFYTTDGLKPDSYQMFIESVVHELTHRYFHDKEIIKIKRGDRLCIMGKIIEV